MEQREIQRERERESKQKKSWKHGGKHNKTYHVVLNVIIVHDHLEYIHLMLIYGLKGNNFKGLCWFTNKKIALGYNVFIGNSESALIVITLSNVFSKILQIVDKFKKAGSIVIRDSQIKILYAKCVVSTKRRTKVYSLYFPYELWQQL